MSNILVCPNLYNGSALTEVTRELIKTINENKLDIKIIKFKGPMTTLKTGCLDDPDIFFDHSIKTIEELKKIVKKSDKILFVDSFQLGIGLLHYYTENKNIDVKYGGLFHGASFVKNDFFSKVKWVRNFEYGMLDLMDKVYTASNYAASFFNKRFKHKIKVIPFGFNANNFTPNLDSNKKEFDVILPFRWSWDRDPIFFKRLIERMPEIIFAIPGFGENENDPKLREIYQKIISKRNVINLGIKTGEEHYKNLKKSKVVVCAGDTFGYGFREAMACGCIPVLYNGSCYPEFIDKKYLFNNIEEAEKLIKDFLNNYPKDYIKPNSFSSLKILEDFYYER